MTGGSARRLGIVGFGRLARRYYVPALRVLGEPARIAVADPLEASRSAARGALPGVGVYPDLATLLDAEPVDALLVASPPSSHLKIWAQAAARELPVFMEKPFLMADELARVDPSEPTWRNLMVDFNRRFWPAYRRLAELISSGAVGRLSDARFTLHIDPRAWARSGDHRSDESEGGALYDLGCHVLDLVFVTLGEEPVRMSAQRTGETALEQRVVLNLEFASGLVVEGDLAYGPRNREAVRIRGENGQLRMEDPNRNLWLERRPGRLSGLLRTAADLSVLGFRGVLRQRSMLRYSVAASIGSFLEALSSGRPFSPGFAEAYRVALWTAAAARSIERGEPVALERDTRSA